MWSPYFNAYYSTIACLRPYCNYNVCNYIFSTFLSSVHALALIEYLILLFKTAETVLAYYVFTIYSLPDVWTCSAATLYVAYSIRI